MVHAQVTGKQKRYIEQMTPVELYDAYTASVVYGVEMLLQTQGVVLEPKQKSEFSKCIRYYLVQEFTAEEMKELFIQPVNMNRSYYDKKLEKVEMNTSLNCMQGLI